MSVKIPPEVDPNQKSATSRADHLWAALHHGEAAALEPDDDKITMDDCMRHAVLAGHHGWLAQKCKTCDGTGTTFEGSCQYCSCLECNGYGWLAHEPCL